ncbi:hypothetical protein [Heliomarina baculiformis]|uniref:hypothetical protein n=1 Tax=Heliomarina baculiformis TaxID=2872036 RepID=UPI001EE308A9|nr:hypothetical protein [Heliomarina baculiformis]
MRFSVWIFCVIGFLGTIPGPLLACRIETPINIQDIELADLIVIGTVKKYAIVLNANANERRQEKIQRLADDANPQINKILKSQIAYPSDYARFEIHVEQVLKGDSSDEVTAVWDNSTFAEPDRLKGETYLIALVAPTSPRSPLRGPSTTLLPHPDGESFSVLQAPCSTPFLFEADSSAANEVRIKLGAGVQ